MGVPELIQTEEELKKIAALLYNEIKYADEPVVSRYYCILHDTIGFFSGKKSIGSSRSVIVNKEMMRSRVYSVTGIDDLFDYNFNEVVVERDLHEHRFHFHPKGIPLPTGERTHFEGIPSNPGFYDDELREFTREHRNARVSRTLNIEQKVIVNSDGGIFIQSIPFFEISYNHGYSPIPTHRNISAVCASDDDVRRLPALIKYISDPTPDKKIKSSKSFAEAFHELHNLSPLRFGSLEDAGIPLSELYDVVILTGVPVHEIFGHHFEEPIRLLNFGESGTFKYGQMIHNKDILIKDNPKLEIEGFRVRGFTYFDAYGREREPRTHIENGRVVGFLGGEYADSEKLKKFMGLEKSEFAGSSSQYLNGFFPQPRMSCTIIDGKTESIDLEGKILLVPHQGFTDQHTKTYTLQSFECYVVKNGRPMRVIPLQVTGGINQALRNIILLDDLNYQTGMCGKPEPLHYPSYGVESVPVSQFARTQVWKDQQVYPSPISDAHLKMLAGNNQEGA